MIRRNAKSDRAGNRSVAERLSNRSATLNSEIGLDVKAHYELSDLANRSPQVAQTAQLQSLADNNLKNQEFSSARWPNQTGLPDQLKSGVEQLSGIALDDVRVHYNSNKPAQLQARAYARGAEIHLASGQEKHLPHETWHVVQQKQGRVRPTSKLKGNAINDDPALEREADIMGSKALSIPSNLTETTQLSSTSGGQEITQLYKELKMFDKWSDEDEEAYRKLAQDAYQRAKQFRDGNEGGYCVAVGCVTLDGVASGFITSRSNFATNQHAEAAVIEAFKDMDFGTLNAIFVEYKPCVQPREKEELETEADAVMEFTPHPCSVYLRKILPENFPVFYLGWPHKAI